MEQHFRTLCGLPQELWSPLHWPVQVEPTSKTSANVKNTKRNITLIRFRDNTASFNASSKRYVITNPPGEKSFLFFFVRLMKYIVWL